MKKPTNKTKKNKQLKYTSKKSMTTMKLQKETKQRIEKLREHKRETYDDILRKILWILNNIRPFPEKAQNTLNKIDEQRARQEKEKLQVED